MKTCTIWYKDGSCECRELLETPVSERVTLATLAGFDCYDVIDHVDFPLTDGAVPAGDDGFYLIPECMQILTSPSVSKDYGIGYFRPREDCEYAMPRSVLPVFGVKHGGVATVAIVTGMPHDTAWCISVKDNAYNIMISFQLKDKDVYEAPAIEYHVLDKAGTSYADMAREYREYQLARGFRPIKERLNPELKYMTESINVRIRMAWKPVPCTIYNQSRENEPPVHVACTFDDVIRIMEAYHEAGVKKAEFCLVGWNKSGHDGRWPEVFPAEPLLGGDEGLARVIKRARELGYAMTNHTNSTDGYSIAGNFSFDDIAVKRDATISIEARRWGGGATYNICPARSLPIWEKNYEEIAARGFRGMQYIDVITCTPARECYNPRHRVNKKQAPLHYDALFARVKELFGAVGCEGPYDHSLRECDSTLYVAMVDYVKLADQRFVLCEKFVPFWQLVYHGIVVSNPYARTVNPLRSDNPDDLLKVVEYGGRPQAYYYAKFVSNGSDWIGKGDLTVESDEAIREGAAEIKRMEEIYDELSYLQYEFMEEHDEIAPGVLRTVYSDGSATVVDYNKKEYKLIKANG